MLRYHCFQNMVCFTFIHAEIERLQFQVTFFMKRSSMVVASKIMSNRIFIQPYFTELTSVTEILCLVQKKQTNRHLSCKTAKFRTMIARTRKRLDQLKSARECRNTFLGQPGPSGQYYPRMDECKFLTFFLKGVVGYYSHHPNTHS